MASSHQVNRYNDPRLDKSHEQHVIDFGQYWRYCPVNVDKDTMTRLIENELYIVTDVKENVITEQYQTINVYCPTKGTTSVDIDDFLLHFKYVPDKEADEERKRLLNQLDERTKEITQEISQALKDPQALLQQIANSDLDEVVEGRKALHIDVALPSPEMMNSTSTELIGESASITKVDKTRKQLQNQVQLGNLAKKVTDAKSRELSTVLNTAKDIMMEKSQAVQGKADDMNRRVKGVMSKVDMMNLYMGEDVEVNVIIEGEPSNKIEPYTLFSHMLFMDEEMATQRLFSDNQSFDYSNQKDFFETMRSLPDLVDRLLPLERCIVTIRPRRTSHSYHGEEMYLTEWQARDRANKSAFLLVRNGLQICAIHTPITYKERLYPTDKEMDGFFTGVFANDTRIVDQQRRFAESAQQYRSLCAALQGIKDRHTEQGSIDVFGELPLEATGNSFMIERCVRQNLVFVNDEDNLIGQNNVPSNIYDWFSNYSTNYVHNKDDLVIYTSHVVNQDTTPSIYRWHEHSCEYIQDWKLEDRHKRFYIDRVQLYKGEPYLNLPFEHEWNNSKRNARVFFKRRSDNNDSFNIMEVDLAEIERILQSRELRPTLSSHNYMNLLTEAREVLMGIYKRGQVLIERLAALFPDADTSQIQQFFMLWMREVGKDWESQLTTDKLDATTAKAQSLIKRANRNYEIAIEKALKVIISKNDKPLYLSMKNGEPYVICDGHRHTGSFPITLKNFKHPFFFVYKVNLNGTLKDLGVIGSEIQTYPMTKQLVDDLKPYLIDKPRLSKDDYKLLSTTAFASIEKFRKVMSLVNNAVASECDNTISEAIHELLQIVEKDNKHLQDDKKSVVNPVQFIPVQASISDGDTYIGGISYSILRLVVMLWQKLGISYRIAEKGLINDFFDDHYYFDDAIDELTERELTTDWIGYDGNPKLTKSFISHFVLTEKYIYRSLSKHRHPESMKQAFKYVLGEANIGSIRDQMDTVWQNYLTWE